MMLNSNKFINYRHVGIISRGLLLAGGLFMLSSLFIPWVVLPMISEFPCRPPPFASCIGEGEVLARVNLWQVFTHQVTNAVSEPLTYISMFPILMAILAAVFAFSFAMHPSRWKNIAFALTLSWGLVTQLFLTLAMNSFPISFSYISGGGNGVVLLVLPFLIYLLILLGGIGVFLNQRTWDDPGLESSIS